MGFAGGVQCAEWGLRRWDLRPCLPARACVDPPCVNAEQHHRACSPCLPSGKMSVCLVAHRLARP